MSRSEEDFGTSAVVEERASEFQLHIELVSSTFASLLSLASGTLTRRISGKVCRRCDFVSLSALWRSGTGMTGRVIAVLLSAPSPLTPSAASRYVGLAETDTLGPINSTSKLPL